MHKTISYDRLVYLVNNMGGDWLSAHFDSIEEARADPRTIRILEDTNEPKIAELYIACLNLLEASYAMNKILPTDESDTPPDVSIPGLYRLMNKKETR